MLLNSILRDNKALLTLQLLLLLLGSYPLLAYNKVNLFLQLNNYHHPWLDHFFWHITLLGSSITYLLLTALLVGMRQDNRTILISISSFVIMSILIQGLKSIELFDQMRPIHLTSPEAPLHLVAGMKHRTYWSFPSGHAGTIFMMIWLIHLMTSKKSLWLSVTLLFVACVVAYSRVYLCQHFYRDIYVGALIGTCTTIAVYTYLKPWQGPAWLDQTLFDLWPLKASPQSRP